MTEKMTEERLAELQSTRDKARSWAGLPGEVDDVFTDLADAVDEVDRLRAENERLAGLLPPGTCDWGDCDEPAEHWRLSDRLRPAGYLPVCSRHRSDATPAPELSQHDAFNRILDQAYRNTRGAFA